MKNPYRKRNRVAPTKAPSVLVRLDRPYGLRTSGRNLGDAGLTIVSVLTDRDAIQEVAVQGSHGSGLIVDNHCSWAGHDVDWHEVLAGPNEIGSTAPVINIAEPEEATGEQPVVCRMVRSTLMCEGASFKSGAILLSTSAARWWLRVMDEIKHTDEFGDYATLEAPDFWSRKFCEGPKPNGYNVQWFTPMDWDSMPFVVQKVVDNQGTHRA